MNKEPEYAGLCNQGATCYMNSLLQTLFMTPEFRQQIYEWEFSEEKHGSPVDSIPLQLQSLFITLQTIKEIPASTKLLTRAFQWDSYEVFQQHDVQEFCRVLFDAIEQSVERSFIKELYEGFYTDYVQCLTCKTETSRQSSFLDLSLTVSQNPSIEEALLHFTAPEELNNENQFFCESCGEKSDAIKGLKLTQLPYIMVLHLNRFTLDDQMQRVKLNNEVSFPFELDMNSVANIDEKFELFSVMVHSGSAVGGHYYAYIKSFEKDAWFEFNDSIVTDISQDRVSKAFGSDNSSSNAYLLMYRKIDSEKNLQSVNFSEHLLKIREEQMIREQEIEEERMVRRNTINVKVYYKDHFKLVEAMRTAPLENLKIAAIQEFDVPQAANNVRLRGYSEQFKILQNVYNEKKVLDVLGIHSAKVLKIETKEEDEDFPDYDPTKITVVVHVWDENIDIENESAYEKMTSCPLRLTVDKEGKFVQVKKAVYLETSIPEFEQLFLKKTIGTTTCTYDKVVNPYHTLPFAKIYDGTELFVEKRAQTSKWEEFIKQENNKILIYFNDLGHNSNFPESSKSVKISKLKTIGDLKETIAKKIGTGDIVLRKGFNTGVELSNVDQKICTAGMYDKSYVHVSKETNINIMKIRVFRAEMSSSLDSDNSIYTFTQEYKVSVPRESTVGYIREELSRIVDPVTNPSNIRLRDKFNDKLGKVLKSSDVLKTFSRIEKKVLGMQLLEFEEPVFVFPSLILIAKCWIPANNELSAPVEIVASRTWSMNFLGEKLSELFGIPPELIEVCRVKHVFSFTRDQILTHKFVGTFGDNKNIEMGNLNLDSDGDFIVVRNSSDAPSLPVPSIVKTTEEYKKPKIQKHVSKPLREEGVSIKVVNKVN